MASQYGQQLLDLGSQTWDSVKKASAPYIGDQTQWAQTAGKLGFNNSITNPVNTQSVAQQQNTNTGQQARDWLNGKGATDNGTSQYIKPILDLKFDGLKNSPGFDPRNQNTSPIQTVSPYQMGKNLSSAFQPNVNTWANDGMQQNQQKFDNATQSWQDKRNQLGNVSVGNALLMSMDMNQQRNLMKQSNDQLSNDKKYASQNLENNNTLMGADLNNRRASDISSANTNNDINRINMQNSQYGWDRNLDTFKANALNDQNNNANNLKNLEAKLEFNKNVPALQKVQSQQQLLGDLSNAGDTKSNRDSFFKNHQDAIVYAQKELEKGNREPWDSLTNDYNNQINNAQASIYNRPEYALSGITNPKAIARQTADVSIDANGNKQVDFKGVQMDSPLLQGLVKPQPKQVIANSQVDGGIVKY